jgi:sulfhydrogenase subunit alpha
MGDPVGREHEMAIKVPVLARVEGEGALELSIKGERIEDLKLRIYEPPRLFEKFLEGRDYSEVADTVARICGICPVAYQMCAVHALESVFEVQPGHWVRDMRRLFYCGEWMESHALHIHLLAAPDFLGYGSAAEMARHHPEEVKRGLRLQALGNQIIRLLGARSVHPVGAKVGGFHRAPSAPEVATLLERLREALPDAEALLAWSASLPLADDDQEFVCVALRHPDEYPMNEGRLVSSEGLDIDISEFDEHFEEMHVPHSTALHARLHGRPYLVGPLARLNLNQDRLPQPVRTLLERTGIRFPGRNMFHSIVARAAETYYALLEAIRLLEGYRVPESPDISVTPRVGVGFGCTEAPRGVLWHRYEVDARGHVVNARIVPPTSQNQARMEEDLRLSLQSFGLGRSEQELRLRGETVIRNYDPCISCATHFLKLHVHRS